MYDNVDMNLERISCSNIDFLKTVPQYLTSISTHGISQHGEYLTGYLDSLKVTVSEGKVKIHNSSLPKFFLGDNFKTLTRGDTARAIENISDCLHLPIEKANVTRIDFAQNFIMRFNEKVYYPYLGEAQYYNRLEQNNGLYYNNQKRQLIFYGKEYEQKIKKQPIPELYRDRNVLRFEMRFRKQLKQQLKQSDINAGLLSDEEFFRSLLKRWHDEYFAIQKINSKLSKIKATGSKKEFIENLAFFTILELGQPQVLDKIKEWQESGDISKKQAYDIRASIKRICKYPVYERGNDLIDEMDRKVKEAAKGY